MGTLLDAGLARPGKDLNLPCAPCNRGWSPLCHKSLPTLAPTNPFPAVVEGSDWMDKRHCEKFTAAYCTPNIPFTGSALSVVTVKVAAPDA
jgi:hypothetical protein